jgi:hypothetical protein
MGIEPAGQIKGQDPFRYAGLLVGDGPGGGLADFPAGVAEHRPDQGLEHLGLAAEVGMQTTAELLGRLDPLLAVAAAKLLDQLVHVAVAEQGFETAFLAGITAVRTIRTGGRDALAAAVLAAAAVWAAAIFRPGG